MTGVGSGVRALSILCPFKTDEVTLVIIGIGVQGGVRCIVVGGSGGLIVRSRLWGRRVPDSKPDSTEDTSSIVPALR
ncbi:hypothetical protein AVEN_214220-1 [Araneus ventricosus]|uniref:Uncharacterized protein n=1 Tax=Araneus ventricosus TaxID=182803 RepID=A0A4Y2H052_ARAVE|nr:hypothetical protein AVEN_214220-1 [Araneus ventricosus]